jgi:hypothetical protein
MKVKELRRILNKAVKEGKKDCPIQISINVAGIAMAQNLEKIVIADDRVWIHPEQVLHLPAYNLSRTSNR